ncbi:MAG: DNA polymerase III subunit gamma/tau [Hyphomicrobiales bacterium]
MLYGRYRPAGFEEVVGQDHIVTTLRNALKTGQVAHAYLFSGPRGTGKTTTARILARAVNCLALKDGDPCGACAPCEAIGQGRALDLIEMDAASNRGIDDIRELRDKIAFAPSDLSRKVYLLDEVHMLTPGAFNALLKTLEEPPDHAIFILATTEFHSVPATIVSRCQRYDFHRVPNDAIIRRLTYIAGQEGFTLPEQGYSQIAIQSRGGLRDAITLMEQVVARYGDQPTFEQVLEALGLVHDERSEQLARALIEEDLAAALDIAHAVADDGIDIARFTRETVNILRDVLPQVVRGQPNEASPYAALAQDAMNRPQPVPRVLAAISELAKADFRLDPASPIPLEVACGAAIVGTPVAVAAAPADGTAAQPGRPRPAGQPRPASGGGRQAADAPLTREERFLKDLYERSRMADVKVAAKLHACEVLSMTDDTIEFGVFHKFHLDSLEREGRPLLEQQTESLLGRPMRLTFKLTERQQQSKRPTRSGHLVEAARAIPGATPVQKDT